MKTDAPILERLLAAIRATSGRAELDWSRPPLRLSGGFWAQMWRIRLTDDDQLGSDLVARVMPDAEIAARETVVQANLARVGYPTPTVRLAAPPGPELEQAWMLMDHAPGAPLLTDLSGVGAIARLPRMARALPDCLAHHAAALHALDPASITAASETTRDDVGDLLDNLRNDAAAIDRADLTRVANQLHQRRPTAGPIAICHGDLHPFNILTDPAGDTVLDWSAARLAHPGYDIGFTRLLLSQPPLSAPPPLRPLIVGAGRSLARRFVRSYADRAGQPIARHDLNWYGDLHALRIVTEVASWRARDELHHHPDHPFVMLEPTLALLLHRRTGITVEAP